MKTYLLSFLFLLFSISSFSQESQLPEKKIRFGVSVASQVNNHSFSNSQTNNDGTAWGVGINGEVYYQINPILEIKSGFGFSRYSVKVYDYSLIFGCDITNNLTFVDNSERSRIEFEDAEYFLHIPIAFQVNFSKNKNHFFWTGGIALMFRVAESNRAILYECGNRTGNISFTNSSGDLLHGTKNISTLNTGVGYSLGLNNGTRLILSPYFEYAIKNAFEKNNSILSGSNKDKMISYGIRFGFNL